MAIPQVIKTFVAFVDGVGYAGKGEDLSLPKLAIKKEEWRPGGQDAPIELDMGMDKMESTFTMVEYLTALNELFGLINGPDTSVIFRGAMQAQGQDAVPIVATIRGRFMEVDSGTWKSGEKTTQKFTCSVNYYKLTINGVDVYEIDVVYMVRNIAGVDQMASLRAALGI